MSEVTSTSVAAGLPVGEYVLDEKIGQGSFGEVWRAHHRAWTDQLSAVKIPTDPAFLRQLQSEGFSLHRLNHPNIVRVVGFDPGANPPYLMSELVEGASLRQLLSQGPLPVAHAIAILRQILAGLAYAHGRGAVHGDLKPENVLVESAGRADGFSNAGSVKLTDFGVGMVRVTAALGSDAASKTFRSDRAAAVNTLAYIAPEQRDGTPGDAKTDLFSCGVIMFELLTGERPGGAESPSEINPAAPVGLDTVFRRAYARRDRRYSSAKEFLDALDAAAAQLPAASSAKPKEAHDVIGFRADDDPAPVATSWMSPSVAPAPVPPPAPIVAPAPVAAPTPPPAAIAPQPASIQVPKPPPPKQIPRAVVVVDELVRRPLRTADDLRAQFRRVYATRELDEGEVANLRLRLDQWAESVGGLPGFGEKLDVTEALDCPFYRLSITTHYEQEDGPQTESESAVVLANPAASQDCSQVVGGDDFALVLHLSTGFFTPALLDLIGIQVVRLAANNLVNSARMQAGARRIVRQEMKLSWASVLSLRYLQDTAEASVCFAGNNLTVVAPIGPVMRMRDELLKRAAALLDTENIGAGINELRLMFMSPGSPQPRAERMLSALRAKLSSAYMSLARLTVANLGVLESLTLSTRAGELNPGNSDVEVHAHKIYTLAYWVQAGPGIVIGSVFALIALVTRPFFYGYVTASIGAFTAGILIWRFLRTSVLRTDVAFCHACVVPLAVAAVLATGPKNPRNIQGDIVVAILLAIIFVLDRQLFRKFGQWLLRRRNQIGFAGTSLDILNQVQTLLEPDWERLREHYTTLEPLYKHAVGTQESLQGLAPVEPTENRHDDAIAEHVDDLE